MLKGLFSLSGGNLSKITNGYKNIDKHQAGLAKKIAHYIIKGEDASVLSLLNTIPQDQLQEAGIWRPDHYRYYDASQQVITRVDHFSESLTAIVLTDLLFDPQVCRRFGNVLAQCIDLGSNNSSDLPDWLAAIFIILPDVSSSFAHKDDTMPTTYNAQWLKSIAEENDIEQKTWLRLLLESQHNYHYSHYFFEHLQTCTDWEPIFQEAQFIKNIEGFHFSARERVASLLLEYPKIDTQLKLVTTLLTDKSKQVRDLAKMLLPKMDIAVFQRYILETFDDYPTARRKEIAHLITLFGDDTSTELLEHVLQTEKSQSVVDVIQASIANKNAARADQGRDLVAPPISPIENTLSLPAAWRAEIKEKLKEEVEKAKKNSEEEKKYNKENKTNYSWQTESYKRLLKLTSADIERTLTFLESGEGSASESLETIFDKLKIQQRIEFKLPHIVRFLYTFDKHYNSHDINLYSAFFQQWLSSHTNDLTDLRQLAAVLKHNNIDHRCIAHWLLRSRWESSFELPDTGNIILWPFFHEHEEYLKEAFGLSESKEQGYWNFELGYGILITSQFPVIPEQYLQVMYQHALSPAKTYGALCRKAIENYGLVTDRVIMALKSSKQEERIIAANWIADSASSVAIEPLGAALKKEKRETAKAALLSALHRLGQNIDHYLSPETLLKEAESGLKKAIPKGISWFPFASLPALKWRSLNSVDERIIRWWIVLACKLKQPEGNPLLDLYTKQLDIQSQKILSLFILQVYIGRDTACPSDEEAKEYANDNKNNLYSNYQRWAKSEWGHEYRNKTIEDAFQILFMERKSQHLFSAIGEKGILCLITHIEGAEAVQIVSRYMKDHYTRRHQIEAILSALANNNDPVIIQLLLSIARRHRTHSIQEKAKALVEKIAERNHWSSDELADRTIPTAGLETNGTQKIQIGSRELTLKLSADLKLTLENEQGKILKSLPAARQDDDPEQIKQAKKYFSTAKKELKQVIELQSSRFYEAMCITRQWAFPEWKKYLLEHPIVSHLAQRLVWTVTEQEQSYQIRPTAELELIDENDDEYEPNDNASIKLTHISELDKASAQQWILHFKDEKIKPLFPQFVNPKHTLTNNDLLATKLAYHEGWMTDTFTIRGILTKRGYKRGEAEDGGHFSYYYKDFTALNTRAIIEFSGNCLPEENIAAVLYYIAFAKPNNRGWISENTYKSIADIPQNLVNEIMLDYEAVAEKANYDEDWKTKSPW